MLSYLLDGQESSQKAVHLHLHCNLRVRVFWGRHLLRCLLPLTLWLLPLGDTAATRTSTNIRKSISCTSCNEINGKTENALTLWCCVIIFFSIELCLWTACFLTWSGHLCMLSHDRYFKHLNLSTLFMTKQTYKSLRKQPSYPAGPSLHWPLHPMEQHWLSLHAGAVMRMVCPSVCHL